MTTERITYDDDITRKFVFASVIFGLVGLLVGVIVALQLAFWQANVGPYLSFGRLRPLHTNAVIFAFVGNMMFGGVYYSTQRLLKTPIVFPKLAWFHFWSWQTIIAAAAITLPLGFTQGKEYAELEWPIDVLIALSWLAFAGGFFGMMAKRREKQLYVALWFYIATLITITVLHVVNSLAIPIGALKSYSVFGGVQDALVQWWYGHNAVAFFLTTPILGIMYYFIPKAANRPVFSYRLSIIHFWSLVFLYIWAGPHHLLNTALPEWAQTLGMIFSVMLVAPSWGGMLNGLLTLRGAWTELRNDPVLKFFAAAVTFYGMATFEGPLLSIKAVNALSHYTDWTVGHVHVGALGWNGFMAAGMFYWLVPRMYRTKLHSQSAANLHFYIATFGILLYVIAMWVAGITQGLMWRAENESGGLMYPSFVETLLALKPMYWTRLIGGTLYLVGFVMMMWNLAKTVATGSFENESVEVQTPPTSETTGFGSLVFGRPVISTLIVMALFGASALVDAALATVLAVFGLFIAMIQVLHYFGPENREGGPTWHHKVEGRAAALTALTVVSVLAGGIAEIVPLVITSNGQIASAKNVPYSGIELEGRDVFIREGCYNCHSQMVRPFTWETARYGAPSTQDDSIFDHPFQWGSKRTGPDLARLGGRYSNLWHYRHMLDPRELSVGSNMPSYAHLRDAKVAFEETPNKLRAMRAVGVPYRAEDVQGASADAARAGQAIADSLREEGGVEVAPDAELVALIAYLQRLGKPPAAEPTTVAAALATEGGR